MHRDIFRIRIASLSPSDINTAWGQTFAHLLAYKFDKVMNSDWPLDIVYREKSFSMMENLDILWCYIYFTKNVSVRLCNTIEWEGNDFNSLPGDLLL